MEAFVTRTHLALLLCSAVATLGSGPCGPLLKQAGPVTERRHPTIVPTQFQRLGTVAGASARTDRQISAHVRKQLIDSGLTVVALPGRFDSEKAAVTQSCAPGAVPAIDGVLFVWHNRLELHDCVSEVVAYEVSGEGQGINQMADRLVAYLKGSGPTQ